MAAAQLPTPNFALFRATEFYGVSRELRREKVKEYGLTITAQLRTS